jgi:hypothetical protein
MLYRWMEENVDFRDHVRALVARVVRFQVNPQLIYMA